MGGVSPEVSNASAITSRMAKLLSAGVSPQSEEMMLLVNQYQALLTNAAESSGINSGKPAVPQLGPRRASTGESPLSPTVDAKPAAGDQASVSLSGVLTRMTTAFERLSNRLGSAGARSDLRTDPSGVA
jgi:hypothetical protein